MSELGEPITHQRERFAVVPFRYCSMHYWLGVGGLGTVIGVGANLAFKYPHMWQLYTPGREEARVSLTSHDESEMEQNVERMESEKKVYDVLNSHPHPNIMHTILHVPEGTFMPRMQMNLEERLRVPNIVTPDQQERWIHQLSSAAAWLERLGYAHNDLRPANVLLDKADNIKITDFDIAMPVGTETPGSLPPFAREREWAEPEPFVLPIGGPETEQFAVGSCIYNIRFRVVPYSDMGLETNVWTAMLTKGDFPPIPDDRFGDIIRNCWNTTYPSMAALHADVASLTKIKSAPPLPSRLHRWHLLAECHAWLAWQRRLISNSLIKRLVLRCHYIYWTTLHSMLGFFHGGN